MAQRFSRVSGSRSMCLCSVLDHDDGRIDHGAYGDGDAPQGHDVGADALVAHDDEGGEDAEGEAEDGNEGRAQVEEERRTHQGDDDELLHEAALEDSHGALDEPGAIIDRHQLHPIGQSPLEIRQLGLDGGDGVERVVTLAHQHDAAGHLSLAVQLGHPTAHLGAQRTSAMSPRR